ncbi:16S rRNA (guanine(966)-N(2))-methyltransferase RsmD [Fusibacter ferrireducens]|uniref:16S rRNA (Guanine(966)-N(2))-methyltransferase RsmD n=1 Tax=Fusibacter ferrireducens TaxID=2785058 RepID=A0ABR9ZMJ8_9FIRM|nr:16S rRNA (guanine(966)-N(2))-methyltransferase RsmD [Fusibacter ferrireducens]MBF4691685.1 16S rRNA (guanine(966)-N(2))-methyltransferase RsmD [Fusibacter ferrireducens]
MRVISGSARGMTLETIEGLETRPTTDRVKEALFSMIQNQIYGAVCLDLFSGSGALGIELISRGADQVVFCENNLKAKRIIDKNIEKAAFGEKARILSEDVYRFLETYRGEPFDVIVMDPPYLKGHVKKTLTQLERYNLLGESGIIVVEHDIEDAEALNHGTQFLLVKTKKYGKIGISIYRRQA